MSHSFLENLRRVSHVVCVAAAVVLTGCASHYVDGATREINASEYRKPATPKPVQVAFEFQTKGVANAQATKVLQPKVIEKVKASGLFASVEEKPVQGGALLSVKLNNVPLTDDIFQKGFVTGLTFGLAGSQASDGYICTVSYMGEGQSSPIVKTARHAIHTTMGATAQPGNARKAASIEEAVFSMVSQIMSNALNDLSKDPAFAANNN